MDKKKDEVINPVDVKKQEYASNIEAWKKQYGKVKMCLIGGDKAVFFKLPSRAQVQCAENIAFTDDGKFDAHKKAVQLMADCYLGGDYTEEQIYADVEVYMPVSKYVIFQLVEEKKTVSIDC